MKTEAQDNDDDPNALPVDNALQAIGTILDKGKPCGDAVQMITVGDIVQHVRP